MHLSFAVEDLKQKVGMVEMVLKEKVPPTALIKGLNKAVDILIMCSILLHELKYKGTKRVFVFLSCPQEPEIQSVFKQTNIH